MNPVEDVILGGMAEGQLLLLTQNASEKMLLQLLLQPLPTHQLQQPKTTTSLNRSI
jgi:hypothetical protein